MPFPEVRRVIYRNNPLDKVICQLRFPPLLRIDAEIPAAFQERIRDNFPNYSEAVEWQLNWPSVTKGEIPSELLKQIPQLNGKNHEFSSEDGLWKLNLTRTFIALTANRYENWKEFLGKLNSPLSALLDIYIPHHFTRIGLRYINVIKRSALNLSDVSWSELLKPPILGILSSQELRDRAKGFDCKYEISLADGESIVRIVTTLVRSLEGEEVCFMIDNDFSNDKKTDIGVATEKLNYFNVRASRLIQWCITDRLHEAMEPEYYDARRAND